MDEQFQTKIHLMNIHDELIEFSGIVSSFFFYTLKRNRFSYIKEIQEKKVDETFFLLVAIFVVIGLVTYKTSVIVS